MELQEYVIERARQISQDTGYQRRNQRIADTRERRFLEHAPQIPDEYRKTAAEFRAPLIYDVLRRAPGLTTASLPIPHVKPRKQGPRAQETSSLYEKWLKGCYLKMDRGSWTFLKMLDALYADGAAVCKLVLDRHLWAAPGERRPRERRADYLDRVQAHREQNFPFFWEHIPTESYYPIKDEDGLCEAIQITERDALSLAQKYSLAPNGDGKLVPEEQTSSYHTSFPKWCTFTEFWDRNRWAYLVDDTLVKSGEHSHGRPPFFEAQLTITSSPKLEHQYLGLAAPLIGAQDFTDSFLTGICNMSWLTSYATPTLIPTDPNAIRPKDANVEFKIGKAAIPPDGYRWDWMKYPDLGNDLTKAYQDVKAIYDQVGLAPILFGTLPSDASGTLAMTMITVAKAILTPGLKNIGLVFNEMAAFILHAIDTILEEPVPLGDTGIELGPRDINGYYEVEHSLDPILPAERMQKAIFLGDAYARGAVSMRYYREEGIGLEAPEEMDEEKLRETMRESPEYRSTLMQEWLAYHASKSGEPAMPPQGEGTPAALPVAPGGFGQPVVPGVGRPMAPGVPPAQNPPGVAPSG